jgi:outer membrane protein OmpA-like peptidoglycan-associated protein
MKHYILIYTTLLFFSLPGYSQGVISLDLQEFREEGDSLVVNYQVLVSSRAVDTGQGLYITPVIQAADSILDLPSIVVLGRNKEKIIRRFHGRWLQDFISTSITRDTVLHYRVRTPYRLWMDSASLAIRQNITGYRGKNTASFYRLKDRVQLEARNPYRPQPHISFIRPDKEEKRRRRQGKAYLDFQVGRSVVLPGFRRNPEELLKIDEAIRDVISNRDAVLQGLHIEGYASPEGAYQTNERLSRERAFALKEYIRNKFGLSDALFKVTSIAEDWDGLAELVKASDLPQKEKVLDIISSTGVFEGREAVLMRLDKGTAYRRMYKEMFAELRRVEYQLDYTVKDYNLLETSELVKLNPSDLSQRELYDLAVNYGKGHREFNDILLETIPAHFKDDRTAANNAAAVMLTNGELPSALRYLDKAGDSPAAVNNRGVIYLLQGDLDKAEECFMRAASAANPEAPANLEEVKTKRRDNIKMSRYKK